VAYGVWVVDIKHSWDPNWWLDRRFPFNLMPLWVFVAVSLIIFLLSVFFTWISKPEGFRLRCDWVNKALLYVAAGMFVWIVWALNIVHTYYIGDFWVVRILENIWKGKDILALPISDIDVFPTLGDTIIIAYILSFLLFYIAAFRAYKKINSSEAGSL